MTSAVLHRLPPEAKMNVDVVVMGAIALVKNIGLF